MAKKLAITIAGAVSLGSYEAGVAFEVLDAIAQHNLWAEQNSLPEERIEIDVLTGASAGGMTVAIIAQRLLFDGPAMSLPYDNPLFNAWVTDIDITKLLARGPDELPTHSVFSSDCVVAISQAWLTARYSVSPIPPPQPHPALPLDGNLQLGLALSNLNGVDYFRPTRSGGTFVYTDHQDQHLFSMDKASSDRPDLWETIRSTAVACGAFPVAFRVQDLYRNILDYPSGWLDRNLWAGAPSRYFTYTDGGVLENEPLGMAKNLVDMLPGGHLDAEQRGYLFVAPEPKKSSEVPYTTNASADPGSAFGAANATYKGVVQRLVESVIGQAAFQDWIVAEQVNENLKKLDERAGQLQALFLTGRLTAAQAKPISGALLSAFFQVEGVMTPGSLANLQAARNQLKQQYATEYSKFGADTATADAWIDAVLVLELAAGLHEKEEMLIYDFVADPQMLAGDGLDAFGGFFDVAYRKHDYDYGRTMGQQKLLAYQTQPGSVFANLHWTPKPIDPINPSLNNLQMSSVDKTKRQQVSSQISAAADALLQELDVNVFVRKGVMMFFIQPRIKKMLAL
jgi:predicted acylesterase/phospholipase RssA